MNISNRHYRLLIGALASLMYLCACVPVPVAMPQGRPFDDLANKHLRPAETTEAEVRAVFGPPHLWNEKQWIYRDTRLGWQWNFCGYVFDKSGCADTGRGSADYFLVVSFDAVGVLSDFVIRSRQDLCKDKRICMSGSVVSVAAAEHLNAESMQFRALHDSCQVYLFPGDQDSPAHVFLEDEYLGDLVVRDSFFHLMVSPGTQHIRFQGSRGDTVGAEAEIDCQSATLHFAQFGVSADSDAMTIEFLDESIGRREVTKRWRADPVWPYQSVQSTSLRDGEIVVFREPDRIEIYEYQKNGGVKSFGSSPIAETCGILAAIVDYELSPNGGRNALVLMDDYGNRVQFEGVCNATGNCELPSLFELESCQIGPVNTVHLDISSAGNEQMLLIVEPTDRLFPYFKEIYFGPVASIIKTAVCNESICALDIDVLRAGSGDKLRDR